MYNVETLGGVSVEPNSTLVYMGEGGGSEIGKCYMGGSSQIPHVSTQEG